MSPSRAGIINFVMLAFSIFVAAVVAEIGYRFFLEHKTLLTFNATNKPLYEYSPTVGYNYVANTDAVGIYMRNGKVFTYDTISVGPYGNLGNGVRSWGDEDFKILAFGDSFTANPYNNESWTDHVAQPLAEVVGRNVEVMNLGRDGYGVLQMVGLANATVKKLKADLVLIVFITDDLDRARVWRSKLLVDGNVRTLLSVESGPLTSSSAKERPTSDVVVVYPEINLEWCEDQERGKQRNDPILSGLTNYYLSLLDDNLTHSLSSWTTSFLLNRIRYGDPFHNLRNLPRMARIDFQDFHQDEEFVAAIQELQAQPVPVLFIMLPWYPELKAGKFLLTESQDSLLSSLQHLTNGKIINGFDYLETPLPNLDQMFFVPDDLHPNRLGAEVYARSIVRAVKAFWKNHPPPQTRHNRPAQAVRRTSPVSVVSR